MKFRASADATILIQEALIVSLPEFHMAPAKHGSWRFSICHLPTVGAVVWNRGLDYNSSSWSNPAYILTGRNLLGPRQTTTKGFLTDSARSTVYLSKAALHMHTHTYPLTFPPTRSPRPPTPKPCSHSILSHATSLDADFTSLL